MPNPAKDANNVTIATDDESTPKPKMVNCFASLSYIKNTGAAPINDPIINIELSRIFFGADT
jgi:hypothetical protein